MSETIHSEISDVGFSEKYESSSAYHLYNRPIRESDEQGSTFWNVEFRLAPKYKLDGNKSSDRSKDPSIVTDEEFDEYMSWLNG
jgi:hypothetical protein